MSKKKDVHRRPTTVGIDAGVVQSELDIADADSHRHKTVAGVPAVLAAERSATAEIRRIRRTETFNKVVAAARATVLWGGAAAGYIAIGWLLWQRMHGH
jgi:hypothetical protein